MKVAAMFFAESAQHTSDRLQVRDGLWDGLTATGFPAAHTIPVVVLLRLDPSDVGQSFHLDFHVTGPEGAAAGHSHVDVAVNTYRQQTAVVALERRRRGPEVVWPGGLEGVRERKYGEAMLWYAVRSDVRPDRRASDDPA